MPADTRELWVVEGPMLGNPVEVTDEHGSRILAFRTTRQALAVAPQYHRVTRYVPETFLVTTPGGDECERATAE